LQNPGYDADNSIRCPLMKRRAGARSKRAQREREVY